MGTGAGRARPLARAVKRTVDVVGSLLTLVLLAPVLLGVALAVRLRMGPPVLFRQVRVGRDLAPFELLKFRTMRAPAPDEEALLSDADRVTPLGRWLRRTSLDELPTVLNVLRGDMSVVGPRPLLDLHVELFGPDAADRWRVRPGITGLAQVDGRQGLTFRQRLERDLAYARGWSFAGDVAIVLRTVGRVLGGGGVASRLEEDVDDIGLAAAIRARGRREQGSTLQPHGPVGAEAAGPTGSAGNEGSAGPGGPRWVPDDARWFATARQALVAGLAERGVRRVHLPTFGCHDVTRALRGRFEVVLHPDRPGGPEGRLALADDEAVVVVTTFGLPPRWTVVGGTLVLDVTHGPWDAVAAGAAPTDAAGRPADLAVASLRKTLPVPDGALLWAPAGGPLPAAPPEDPAHEATAARIDGALSAKAAWLAGADEADAEVVTKDGPRGWLRALRAGEAALLAVDMRAVAASAVTRTRAPQLDVAARWVRRTANAAALATALDAALGGTAAATAVEVLPAPAFAVLVARDHALRENLRTGLVAARVYPAVLWPTDGEDVTPEDRDLADRILVLHADARSDEAEMARVTRVVADVLTGGSGA